jgi:hypothetical protein
MGKLALDEVSEEQHQAIKRLLDGAAHNQRLANFLRAWWSGRCGGFDYISTDWGIDDALLKDVRRVFAMAARCHQYPNTLGYAEQFARLP